MLPAQLARIMNKVTLKRLIIGEFSVSRLLKSTLIIYALVAIWAIFGTDRLIFLPPPASYTQSDDFIQLRATNGDQITALYLPNAQAQYTILYIDILPAINDGDSLRFIGSCYRSSLTVPRRTFKVVPMPQIGRAHV